MPYLETDLPTLYATPLAREEMTRRGIAAIEPDPQQFEALSAALGDMAPLTWATESFIVRGAPQAGFRRGQRVMLPDEINSRTLTPLSKNAPPVNTDWQPGMAIRLTDILTDTPAVAATCARQAAYGALRPSLDRERRIGVLTGLAGLVTGFTAVGVSIAEHRPELSGPISAVADGAVLGYILLRCYMHPTQRRDAVLADAAGRVTGITGLLRYTRV